MKHIFPYLATRRQCSGPVRFCYSLLPLLLLCLAWPLAASAQTVSTFATVPNASGITHDASGNLYVSSNHDIKKITPAGVVTNFVANSFSLAVPGPLAFDNAGNLFVADNLYGSIIKTTPAGVVTTFATGLNSPHGLRFAANGDLFVANTTGGSVVRITPAGTVSSFASGTGIRMPAGLVFDAAGNLFSPDYYNGNVLKITPTGGVSTFATGATSGFGICFDTGGNLIVSGNLSHQLFKVTPAGVVSPYGSVFSGRLLDITLNTDGFLYVASNEANSVYKISSVATATVPALRSGQVAVFPNPAHQAAFVELPAFLAHQAVTVALLDVLGRPVREQVLAAASASRQVSLAGVAPGIYALLVHTEQGTVSKLLTVE